MVPAATQSAKIRRKFIITQKDFRWNQTTIPTTLCHYADRMNVSHTMGLLKMKPCPQRTGKSDLTRTKIRRNI